MKPHSTFATLLTLLTACGTSQTEPNDPDPTQGTIAAAARPRAKPPEFVGVISSRVSKVIATVFDAKVERLAIRSGQRVKAGEIIATLDDSELKAKLQQAKGNLAAAKGRAARAGAAYGNSARALRNYRNLLDNGVIAAAEFNNKQAELGQYGGDSASAHGEIDATQSQITELETQIAAANVTAPIDGVISIVKVQVGEMAPRGTPIAQVFDPSQPVVRFAVPAAYKPLVAIGTRVELVLDLTKQVVPARVRSIEDDHDPSINYTVCEAAIDPAVRAVAIKVGDNGHVRIAATTGGAR